MRWAWSASQGRGPRSGGRRGGNAQPTPPPPTELENDMFEVVQMLSTATAQMQTVEPSFTATLRQVHADHAGNRQIGIQAGATARHTNAATQVNENDVADVPDSAAYDDEVHGFGGGGASLSGPSWIGGGGGADPAGASGSRVNALPSAAGGSVHRPHCDIPPDRYPAFVADARALGVCNRYGFISMPKPPVELPPRRRIKAICPADYPHLYGTHDLQLDEGANNRINRAHNLWVLSSGFVPKF